MKGFVDDSAWLTIPLPLYLQSIRKDQWSECDIYGNTFLHIAAHKNSYHAAYKLLVHSTVNVNARTVYKKQTAAHIACTYNSAAEVLEVLCAAGADMNIQNAGGYSPLDTAMICAWQCARVLISNGARLRTLNCTLKHNIPHFLAFENGILRCRSAVVALLKVKDRGQLHRWDRFLLAHIALQVWITRMDWEE